MLRRTKRTVSNKTLLQEIMNARNDISQNRCEIQDLTRYIKLLQLDNEQPRSTLKMY